MTLAEARSAKRPSTPSPLSWEKWKASYTGVMESSLRKTQSPIPPSPPPSMGMQSTILLSTP